MSSPTTEAIRLSEVVERIWSRRLTVVACLALGLVAGLVGGALWPTSYTSTALLQISPITSTPFGSTPASQQVNIETERSVMASPETAAAVIRALDLDLSPIELLDEIAVSTPPDSLVLRVSYTDADAAHAADIANAFAEEYLALRASRAASISTTLQNKLEEQIDALVAGDFGDTSSVIVQQQVLELRQEQARLAAVGVDPGNIIGEAVPPRWPSSLSARVFLVAGGALGGLFGVVVALLIEAFDPRAVRAQRVGAATGVPVVVAARRGTDEEAMLQLTSMLIGPLQRADGVARPYVVAVLCPDHGSRSVTGGLGDHVRRTSHSAMTLELSDAHEHEIDRGFPTAEDRAGWTVDVVLLDLAEIESQARRAMVASRSDALVLVARGRTPLSALRYWTNLARTGSVDTPGIWFQKRLGAGTSREPVGERTRTRRGLEPQAETASQRRVG